MEEGLSVNPENQRRRRDTRFRPGRSGNPTGRPRRDRSLTSWLHNLALNLDEKTGKCWAELLGEKVWAAAMSGCVVSQKFILDRIEPVLTTSVVVNQLVLREDVVMRVRALEVGDVDRLLPKD